ncbi:hypothetical protein DFH28DRAFT_531142 [Melampsora americana]|nr:hypothetical protein DFH28DRAFT_531142 [Melampsora americana]
MKQKTYISPSRSWLISYLNLCIFFQSAKPALTPHNYMTISSPNKIGGKSSITSAKPTSTHMNFDLDHNFSASPDQVACTQSWFSSERSRKSSGGSSPDRTSLTFDDLEKLDTIQLHAPSLNSHEWDHSIILSDPLDSRVLRSKENDLPKTQNIQARIHLLTERAHQVEDLLNSMEEEHITIEKAEVLRQELLYNQIILQSSLYELSHLQDKGHSYMIELLKSQADFEDSLARRTNLVPEFVEGFDRLETQLKRSLMMKFAAMHRGEIEGGKSRLADLEHRDQPKIILIQSLNKLSKQHFLPNFSRFSNQAFVVSMYEELLAGFDLSFEEERLIENFKNKEVLLSTSEYELYNECVNRFLIHQLPHDELQWKRDIWSKVISKIELSTDEEMDMYVLENTIEHQPPNSTQSQRLQSLKVRKVICSIMKRYLDDLDDIDQRLDHVRQLSKEEQEFLKDHFGFELIAMRKMLETPGKWDHSPSELQAGMRFKSQARQHHIDIGVHSDINTDLIAARDFVKRIESDLSNSKPKIKMQVFSPVLSELKSVQYIMSSLKKPHLPLTTIEIMKSKGLEEIDKLFSYMMINKQLQVLEEKLKLIGIDDHKDQKLGERLVLIIQELNHLEKRRLMALGPNERGQAMLELIKRCDIKPISKKEDELLVKLKTGDDLDWDEVNHLELLANQYQSAIMSTISENDLALSHFLWLEENGTLSERHDLQDLFLRDPFMAQRVKSTLQRVAFSPMEKAVLFRITEKYMEESLESIVLSELQNKVVIAGSLSHYENEIKNQFRFPNWKKDPDNEGKLKVLSHIYSNHLHSKAITKDANAVYEKIIQGDRISHKMDNMVLVSDEVNDLKSLQLKIHGNIGDQKIEKKVKTILRRAEERSEIIQDLQALRHKLSFNKIKMKELAFRFEKIMREFQYYKEKEEARITYLYKKYLRTKKRI